MAEKNRFWRWLGQHGGELADGVDEAQVEHLVDFVEDEDLDLGQGHGLAFDEVDEAAGRGDENVDAAAQDLDLLADRHAAEDHGARDAQVLAVGAEAVGDLGGEFARRRQDQRTARCRAPARSVFLARCWRIGSAKAAVLPVPVWAMPSRSRPSSRLGMDFAWMGVGVS